MVSGLHAALLQHIGKLPDGTERLAVAFLAVLRDQKRRVGTNARLQLKQIRDHAAEAPLLLRNFAIVFFSTSFDPPAIS
jgi:hypothetical protein